MTLDHRFVELDACPNELTGGLIHLTNDLKDQIDQFEEFNEGQIEKDDDSKHQNIGPEELDDGQNDPYDQLGEFTEDLIH